MYDLEERIGRYLVCIVDAVLIVIAMLSAVVLHQRLVGLVPHLRALASAQDFLVVLALVVPIWLIASTRLGADAVLVELPSTAEILRRQAKLQLVSVGLLVTILWFLKIFVNRGAVAIYCLVSFGLLSVARVAWVVWGKYRNQHSQGRHKVLVLGHRAHRVREGMTHGPNPPSLVPPPMGDGVDLDKALVETLHHAAVDRVVFTEPYTSINNTRHLVEICEERGIPAVFELPQDDTGEREAQWVAHRGRCQVAYVHARSRSLSLALKQLVDTVGTAVGFVALCPLLLLVAAVVLIADGRPIVFSQERIGLRGRRFQMLKFRTMVRNAEQLQGTLAAQNETGGAAFKLRRDPRVTPIGRLLRRTSLDELPQLLNVLAGDMSLVGPRPLPTNEQQKIHGPSRRRLAMKPGITGLWQVGGRSDTRFDDWMKLDLQYVDKWSLWLDLKILARTIPAVLFGSGAR